MTAAVRPNLVRAVARRQPIRFDDGAAYERMMGAWSQLVGQVFLDWLSPATGQRWIDVGCGNEDCGGHARPEQVLLLAVRAERSTAGHAFDCDRMRRAAEPLRVQRHQVRTRLAAGGSRIRTLSPA
jgi:hypothetical protein